MAPLDEYLIADQNSEIALARSAAPASISDGPESSGNQYHSATISVPA
jgi:hypothetical protein